MQTRLGTTLSSVDCYLFLLLKMFVSNVCYQGNKHFSSMFIFFTKQFYKFMTPVRKRMAAALKLCKFCNLLKNKTLFQR